MDGVGLNFIVGSEHETVGIGCAVCGAPIVVGDHVHGHVEISHVECRAAIRAAVGSPVREIGGSEQ